MSLARILCGMLLAFAGMRAGAADVLGPHPGDMKLRRAMELTLGVTCRPNGIPTYCRVVSSPVWDR